MQIKYVTISSMLLLVPSLVQGAPVKRDLASDIGSLVQGVERIANEAASVATSVIAGLPPFLQSPASSIFNEVTAGAAAGFAEVTSILGGVITLSPPTSTSAAPMPSPTPFPTSVVKNATSTAPFQIPGQALSVTTFSPADLPSFLNALLSEGGSGALGAGASISVSVGPTLTSSTGASSSTSNTSPIFSVSPSSSSTSSATATTTAPVIGSVSFGKIAAPAFTLPGQALTTISAPSATETVDPNASPSKRGLGSVIGIVGTELGPLLQDADNLGNKIASIGNKFIAALPSDVQAPASSIFAEATSEVGKGFGIVTSIAGPILGAEPTSTSSTSEASSASETPAAQNAAAQANSGVAASQTFVTGLAMVASMALGILIAL